MFWYIRKTFNKSQRSEQPKNSKICTRNNQNQNRDLFMYTCIIFKLKYGPFHNQDPWSSGYYIHLQT